MSLCAGQDPPRRSLERPLSIALSLAVRPSHRVAPSSLVLSSRTMAWSDVSADSAPFPWYGYLLVLALFWLLSATVHALVGHWFERRDKERRWEMFQQHVTREKAKEEANAEAGAKGTEGEASPQAESASEQSLGRGRRREAGAGLSGLVELVSSDDSPPPSPPTSPRSTQLDGFHVF
jgi:hypothetical protein